MILAKDFISKYGNNPKFVEGFAATDSKQLYNPNHQHWHINKISGDEVTLTTYENEETITKKVYLPDFLNNWYIGF